MTSITVTVREGVFLYDGLNKIGEPIWRFFRRKDDGTLAAAPTPRRWRAILAKVA